MSDFNTKHLAQKIMNAQNRKALRPRKFSARDYIMPPVTTVTASESFTFAFEPLIAFWNALYHTDGETSDFLYGRSGARGFCFIWNCCFFGK